MQISKEKVKSNKHKFLTGLRWLRASSPAIFRPPLTQIWVMNLFPMLLAKLGISIKSEADKLKFGLFTMFPCVQPAFKKAVAVPREATRAQKSSFFSFVILCMPNSRIRKVQISKEKVKSNKHKFLTGLRWLRASSPAIFRPPLTQIWVMNLFPMLLAKLGISIKSEADKLKFGLFTMFPCVQPAFKKAVAVPREATRAQKSACPPITSSRASTSPSICSNVLGKFSAEGVNFEELAPTE